MENSHLFDKGGVWVGEDVSFLSTQIAAGNVEVDPQVGVVSFYRHTDVLTVERGEGSERPGNRVVLRCGGCRVLP